MSADRVYVNRPNTGYGKHREQLLPPPSEL